MTKLLRVEVKIPLGIEVDPIQQAIKQYRIKPQDVQHAQIFRRSLDARANRTPCYVDLIDFELAHVSTYAHAIKKARLIDAYEYHLPKPGILPMQHRPIVVGFGPAGMAAALALATRGYRPIVLERGPKIKERQQAITRYWGGHGLNKEANVQFGEGGAGAFSDGKLTTRVKDDRVQCILQELVKVGADPSILWTHHPHIGTDVLCKIDVRVREKIEELGGEIRFNTRLDDVLIEHGTLKGVKLSTGEELPCQVLVLAIGHSARDTMRMLGTKKDLVLEAKNFAVGVRVEHLQSFVDAQQYRNIQADVKLPAAEYHLSHTASTGKGVYSFCMCPGGVVVDSASLPDTVVTNGMSYASRAGRNANSAIVVQVDASDYGEGLFDGMAFQDQLEAAAFQLGQGKAPYQTISSYLNHTVEPLGQIRPSFTRGVNLADIHSLFSERINTSLTEFFHHTDEIWPNFTTNDALMTAVETRTSSPIRIVRDAQSLCSSVKGLWPAGEGAGFSGGIVSSAIDGLKCAEQIIHAYAPANE